MALRLQLSIWSLLVVAVVVGLTEGAEVLEDYLLASQELLQVRL